MSDYDVVYLDERNAPFGFDRRRPGVGGRRPRPGGSGSSVVVPASRRPTVVHAGGGAYPQEQYAPMGPYSVPMGGYPAPMGYYQDPRVAAPAPIARFWNLSGPALIELGAKALAAFLPLPVAPTGQDDTGLDLENLVVYQSALAEHAKRDERLRTLGELIGRILQ